MISPARRSASSPASPASRSPRPRRHLHSLRRIRRRGCMSVFERLAGEPRGANLARLSTATVRAVAQGGGGCGTHLGDPRWPFPPGCGSTALLLVCGMADNVLKPLMLGRGVDVPMPVILVGALGGMAADGIIGMFVGATCWPSPGNLPLGGSTRTPTQTVPRVSATPRVLPWWLRLVRADHRRRAT